MRRIQLLQCDDCKEYSEGLVAAGGGVRILVINAFSLGITSGHPTCFELGRSAISIGLELIDPSTREDLGPWWWRCWLPYLENLELSDLRLHGLVPPWPER